MDLVNLLASEQATFDEDYRKIVAIDQKIKTLPLTQNSSYKLVIIGNSPSKNKFNLSVYNELVGVLLFEFGGSSTIEALVVLQSLKKKCCVESIFKRVFLVNCLFQSSLK